jgi:hypothetical protein
VQPALLAGERVLRGGRGAWWAQRDGTGEQGRPRTWRGGGRRQALLGVELHCVLRVLEGREGERRKKEKGERRKKEMGEKKRRKRKRERGREEERKRKKRKTSAGFAATVRSACGGFSGKRHARNEEEQRDETVIGTMSLSSTTKKVLKIIFSE